MVVQTSTISSATNHQKKLPLNKNCLIATKHSLEPENPNELPFLSSKNKDVVIVSHARSRKNLFKSHVDGYFRSDFISHSTEEKTREIVLETEFLNGSKDLKFIEEMSSPFDQLSKDEVLEIISQMPIIQGRWTFIYYKDILIQIPPNVKKIYLPKAQILKDGSRVFRIKSITES